MIDEVLALTFVRGTAEAVVRVTGQVDLAAAHVLRGALVAAVEDQPHLTVDLRAVRFMDSSGVAALVDAWQVWQQHGSGRFTLAGPFEPVVAKVLEITGVTAVIDTTSVPPDPGPAAAP